MKFITSRYQANIPSESLGQSGMGAEDHEGNRLDTDTDTQSHTADKSPRVKENAWQMYDEFMQV